LKQAFGVPLPSSLFVPALEELARAGKNFEERKTEARLTVAIINQLNDIAEICP
jgi:hypothetical protein